MLALRVVVNGFERRVPSGTSVGALLLADGEPRGHVLVELNGLFLAPAEYDARLLEEGDRLEVILPAFGG
jgi:thiamine biosynthesis protein ThiS